jgi:hypothetical protein
MRAPAGSWLPLWFSLLALPAAAEAPRLQALRTEHPPRIDGLLDDAVWQQAASGSGFRQREPEELAPATEDTTIRVAFTPKVLYIAIHAHDGEPSALVAREMGRDAELFRDDAVVVLLDTFLDRRNAYFFETNPNSSVNDALMTDEGRLVSFDWDGVWEVKARTVADGWTAELAIPFATLRFDPESTTWGLQVRRMIRRKNEETFWAPLGRDVDMYRMARAGTLEGLEGIEPGLALRVKPYLAAASTEIAKGGAADGDEVEAGVDAKWAISRGMSLDLTVNTDFAETEVDEQQVNLSRFSLFFPEKREFFLENSGIFEFSPQVNANGPPLFAAFHSRRIGIADDGRQTDLEVGLRLAGRQGPWSVGVLGARTGGLDADPALGLGAVAASDWGVVRVRRNVGERSTVGVIATHRDDGASDNQLLGFDVDYKPTERWSFWAIGAQSRSGRSNSDAQEGESGGFGTSYANDVLEGSLSVAEVDPGFQPEAGFLWRRGRIFHADASYSPRPKLWDGLRNLFFAGRGDLFTYRTGPNAGETESVDSLFDVFALQFDSGEFVSLFTQYREENILEPFEIAPGVVLPIEHYRWHDVGVFAETSEGRVLAGSGFVLRGDFFNGTRFGSELNLTWRPSRSFRWRLSWNRNDIELVQGRFVTNVWRQRFDWAFSPDLGVSAFVQRNEGADLLTLNLRFSWHYRPGSDLYVVYNETWDAPSLSDLGTAARQLIVKITWAWDA